MVDLAPTLKQKSLKQSDLIKLIFCLSADFSLEIES